LFHEGSLTAWNETENEIIPQEAEIDAGLNGAKEIAFGLTKQGGTQWESISRPDWNRFATVRLANVNRNDSKGEIICSNRLSVENWLTPHLFGSVVEGSETWDVLTPWQATYWKTLPEGHRVKYRITFDEFGHDLDEVQRIKAIMQLKKWYVNPYG
jgi:hypothetical protein